ncbi:TetR family transcriptional regulator, partial [Acinetobacter nematophilus]
GKGLAHPEAKTKTSMELFFEAGDSSPQQWIFMIAERWGGSEIVRRAISREIDFLNDDLARDLKKFEVIETFRDESDLKVITNSLINLSF